MSAEAIIAAWERRRVVEEIDARLRLQCMTRPGDHSEWVDGCTLRVARVEGDTLHLETVVIAPIVMPVISIEVRMKP